MQLSQNLSRAARIALVLAALAAFGLAILPTMPGPENWNDKLNHFLAFLVLAGLAHTGWPKAKPLLLFVLLTLFGALIEVAQYAMNVGRSAELLDLVADMVGILVGLVLARLALRSAS